MASFNKVILMGNLTRDPQLRYTPSQQAVCDFSLAVNRRWKSQDGQDREEVSFVDRTAWGRTAEVITQYCIKGKPRMVEGRLKQDSWDDKTTGQKRSKLAVVVETMQLLGSRDGGAGGGGGGSGGGQNYSQEGSDDTGGEPPAPRQQSRPAPAQQRPPASRGPAPARPAQQPDAQPPFSEEPQFKDDDIPF